MSIGGRSAVSSAPITHSDQYPYIELHDAMLGREQLTLSALASWLQRYREEPQWLATFRLRSGPHSPATDEELWRLYGLSRVIELLNLSFQAGEADGSSWRGPGLSREEVCWFASALGLTPVVPAIYCPFDCEIVRVIADADRDRPAVLVDLDWPCFMLGDLLISRAGVTIRAGRAHVDGSIAASSTLYWAYRRKHRPYRDLSHGWGHNSQWRTAFRRDYRLGERCYLNVDGTNDLGADDVAPDTCSAMTHAERVEVLIHRCFIRSTTNGDDLWPWDDRLTVTW